jgi:DNA modification methylase
MNVLKGINDETIDLVVTDCPYKLIAGGIRVINEGDECSSVLNKRDWSKTDPKGCLGRGRVVVSDGTNCSNKWLKKGNTTIPSAVKDGKMFTHNDIQFSEWLPELYRVLKKGTHCYIMINGRNLKDLQIAAEDAGFVFQNLLVWHKTNTQTPNKYYMQCMEFILMLSKRPARNINNLGTKNLFSIPNIVGNKVHPCLTEHNTILTEQGMINIKDVKKGDKVLTENGSFNVVNYTTKVLVDKEVYQIKSSGSTEIVEATDNHPFLVCKKKGITHSQPTYTFAANLLLDDYILEPIIDLPNFSKSELATDELYIAGAYLGDGYTIKAGHGNNEYLSFAINKDKFEKIYPILQKVSSKKIGVYSYDGSKKYQITSFDPVLSQKITAFCGKYSHTKSISIDIFQYSKEDVYSFFQGYLDTDGWDFKKRNLYRFKTVSEHIAYQMKNIVQSLGMGCSIQKIKNNNIIENRAVSARDCYQLEISKKLCGIVIYNGKRYKTRQIKYINTIEYKGYVYNLNVNGSHTFLTKVGMSHNTEKPVELMDIMILNSSNEGDLVLDPFMGSGSVPKSCKKNNRKCIGIEIDKEYFDIANNIETEVYKHEEQYLFSVI